VQAVGAGRSTAESLDGSTNVTQEPARLKPFDQKGRRIRRGDWVRLVGIPAVVRKHKGGTLRMFRAAEGRTFRVEGFGRYGHAELDLTKKVARFHTIWVEPDLLSLSRRRHPLLAEPSNQALERTGRRRANHARAPRRTGRSTPGR